MFHFFTFSSSTKRIFKGGGGSVGGETERLPWKQSTSPIWASLMALWRGNNCVPLASLWESVCMCVMAWGATEDVLCYSVFYEQRFSREPDCERECTDTRSCSLVIGLSVGSLVEGNLNSIERLSILEWQAARREKMEKNRAANL